MTIVVVNFIWIYAAVSFFRIITLRHIVSSLIPHIPSQPLLSHHHSAKTHETFIGPPLDEEDGASRVLDPVFSHILSGGKDRAHGNFYKDYFKASW